MRKASTTNNSANTLSMQMMLNQTMLMRTLAKEVDKCPPNGGHCRTKVSVFVTQSPLLRSWSGQPVKFILSNNIVTHMGICNMYVTPHNDDFQRTATQIDAIFQMFPSTVLIKPATWLHFMHDIVVPISRSPQHSWWGLVLAEMCPAQWVTLHNI